MGARLGYALERLVVDANDPETLGVAVRPLEVVEETPHEIAVDRHACLDGASHGPEVEAQIVDAGGIVDIRVLDLFGDGRAVLGDEVATSGEVRPGAMMPAE